MITGAQIKAARQLLGWNASQLAAASRLGAPTIWRAEGTYGEAPISEAHAQAIRAALEKAGVVFPDTDAAAAGPQLRDAQRR
jgi:hypothetical protein